ncbi:unnamed protein product [Heterosigma akashiwo]
MIYCLCSTFMIKLWNLRPTAALTQNNVPYLQHMVNVQNLASLGTGTGTEPSLSKIQTSIPRSRRQHRTAVAFWAPATSNLSQWLEVSHLRRQRKCHRCRRLNLVWHLTTDAQGDAGRKEVEARMLETLRGLESQSMVFYPWSFLAEIEEAEAAVIGDIPFMITATVLLGVYTCIMMTRRHPVQSQGHMGAVGVFGVGLSIMAGFGLVMAIGTPFSLACNSVIFLTLGLGIDDDFVILEAVHSENPRRDGIPKAMARAMSVAGVSITLTSVTDCVTFLIGSTTVIPALSTFSIYAAVVIFVDFLVQVTLYPACVALDLQRQEENRLDTLCCYAVPADSNDFFCFKNVHEKAPEPYLNTFFGEVVPKLIFHPLGKVFVLLSAVGLLVGGIYGASQLEVEFDPKWMVPSTSYISGAYHAEDTYFSTKYRSVKIYTRTAPEGYAAAQDDLQSLLDDCRALEFTVASSIDHNWYESYISWLQLASAGTNLSGLDPITSKPLTEEAFVGNLKTFLNSTSGSHFQDAIVFEDSTIVATRIPQLWLLKTPNPQLGRLHAGPAGSNRKSTKTSLDPFIFQTMFMHHEGFVALEAETLGATPHGRPRLHLPPLPRAPPTPTPGAHGAPHRAWWTPASWAASTGRATTSTSSPP